VPVNRAEHHRNERTANRSRLHLAPRTPKTPGGAGVGGEAAPIGHWQWALGAAAMGGSSSGCFVEGRSASAQRWEQRHRGARIDPVGAAVGALHHARRFTQFRPPPPGLPARFSRIISSHQRDVP
jgi:hypothetical protein